MTELKERLAEMSVEISDQSFVTYIRISLSLTPTVRPLFIALSAAARKSEKPLTSSELIWHLTEEAASTAVEDNINKSNAAMAAQQQCGKGKSKGGRSKSKDERHCTNCSKDRHTKSNAGRKVAERKAKDRVIGGKSQRKRMRRMECRMRTPRTNTKRRPKTWHLP